MDKDNKKDTVEGQEYVIYICGGNFYLISFLFYFYYNKIIKVAEKNYFLNQNKMK